MGVLSALRRRSAPLVNTAPRGAARSSRGVRSCFVSAILPVRVTAACYENNERNARSSQRYGVSEMVLDCYGRPDAEAAQELPRAGRLHLLEKGETMKLSLRSTAL